MLQFIKGTMPTGELAAAEHVPGLEIIQLGAGFIETDEAGRPTKRHVDAAKDAVRTALGKMESGDWDMVILDEVNVALSRGLISDSEMKEVLRHRPPSLTLVLTGRCAPDWLVDEADLVTEMKAVKHPHTRGMEAQQGIEH